MSFVILDFGTYKLKAMKAAIDGNRIKIESFGEWPSAPEYCNALGFPDPRAWTAFNIAFEENGWLNEQGNVILSALPSPYLECRYLELPFRNQKKIEKVLPFELEAQIPFDLEDLIIKHQLLPEINDRPNLVLAMTYRREPILRFENQLRQYHLALPSLTTQNLALTTLRQGLEDVPQFSILHLGHTKSEFITMKRDGTILGLRTILWGGKNLSHRLSQDLQVKEMEATNILHAKGSLEVSVSSKTEAVSIASSLEMGLKPLQSELTHTLKHWAMMGVPLPKPHPIFVTGRPTKTRGLIEQLHDNLHETFSEVEVFPYPIDKIFRGKIEGAEILPDLEGALPLISIALSQTRAHRNIPVFSESSFQFQQNLQRLRSSGLRLARKVAMLLLAPIIYLIVTSVLEQREGQVAMKQLAEQLNATGVEIDLSSPPDQLLEDLNKELLANRMKLKQLDEDAISPLGLLTELSTLIPDHLKIDVKSFKVSGNSILIKASTDNEESKKRIISTIQNRYTGLKTGASDKCTQGGSSPCIEFSIEWQREGM